MSLREKAPFCIGKRKWKLRLLNHLLLELRIVFISPRPLNTKSQVQDSFPPPHKLFACQNLPNLRASAPYSEGTPPLLKVGRCLFAIAYTNSLMDAWERCGVNGLQGRMSNFTSSAFMLSYLLFQGVIAIVLGRDFCSNLFNIPSGKGGFHNILTLEALSFHWSKKSPIWNLP